MKEIKYGTIPTAYRGIQMRSRLEARTAAFLDSYALGWAYEPIDLKRYIPDFLVEFPFGTTLLECKPAINATEFKAPCRKITRSGWMGPALVIGSQLLLGPDDRADLTLFGSLSAEDGGWSRVGRDRWPAPWGDYPFTWVFDAWVAAGNLVQWKPPVLDT
jgi:hypothetical protein